MEFLALVVLASIALLVAGAISGAVALARLRDLANRQDTHAHIVRDLVRRLERLEGKTGAAEEKPAEQTAAVSAPGAPPESEAKAESEPESTPITLEEPTARVIAPGIGPVPAVTPAREAVPDWWASFEDKAGRYWTVWAGVGALFLAAALFAKHAFDSGLIGPSARVGIGVAFGISLLARATASSAEG